MGAPIPRAIVREARAGCPSLVVLGGWGQTEDALVTLGIPGDPEDKIIDTDGYPWPGMEIRTVDFAGDRSPAGTEGRLQVRGPVPLRRLRRAARDDPASSSTDGWFDTGDLANIDEDGYLRISGRTKDVIIRGGENIPVAYVENVLYEHPEIESVAVVGVPDPRLQERACACVVLKAGAEQFTFAEMQEFLATRASPSSTGPSSWRCSTTSRRPRAARSRSSSSATRWRRDQRLPRGPGAHGLLTVGRAGCRTSYSWPRGRRCRRKHEQPDLRDPPGRRR